MAMVYVDKVHYAQDKDGNDLYISELKWTNSLYVSATSSCSKTQMIQFIKNNPDLAHTKYFRYGNWVDGEEIHVVDDWYLRTDKNNIKEDNLENLPRY